MAVFWNPLDKGSYLILSNNNLSARCPSGSVPRSSVRANITKSTGKWYFEIVNLDGDSAHRIGWSTDFSLTAGDLNTSLPYTINAGVGWSMGRTLDRMALSNIVYGSSAASVNAVVMTAIDLTSGGKVWFGLNGTWFSGDPALGTSPADSWSGTYNFLPFITVSYTSLPNAQVTGCFKDFSYSVPDGFSAIDESIPDTIYAHTHALLMSKVVWVVDDLRLVFVNANYSFNSAHTQYNDLGASVIDPEAIGMNPRVDAVGLLMNDPRFINVSGTMVGFVVYVNQTVGALDRPLLFYQSFDNPLTLNNGILRVSFLNDYLLLID